MLASLPLIFAILAVASPASAQEVAYAYGDFEGRPLESGDITPYNETDLVTSVIASADSHNSYLLGKSNKTVEEMKEEINLKLNMGNPAVKEKAYNLVLENPGDGTIGQICSIYEYMVGDWSYKRDPRGIEEFQYSNESLEYGEGRYSGQGDCDDFSILQASLIEFIGCTSRIVLAYSPAGGHAYAEVYMGKAGGPDSDVGRMISWLKRKYKVHEINTHTDLKTGDVWLNLDWWKESGGAKHPGGPFFIAANHVPILVREELPWVPLKPMNDPPVARFTISPDVPNAGESATFNASLSRDIGTKGRIVAYQWDFGDGNKTEESDPEVKHVYRQGGPYMVMLTVEDDDEAINNCSQNVTVNSPPQANFTFTPRHPVVGDLVRFDASVSYDAEDGRNLKSYSWQVNDNDSTSTYSQVSPTHLFEKRGLYWVNLTVTDQRGAKGVESWLLKINQPPTPNIFCSEKDLSANKSIRFSAEYSSDADGKIIGYAWDFGDGSAIDHNDTTFHSYERGGNVTVNLTLEDDDGCYNSSSRQIYINCPPVAKFSIDPVKPKRGELVSFDASASIDPDGKILRYSWDFGDGDVEPVVRTSDFVVHTYYRLQRYNATLTVEDDKGASSSFSQSIEVANGEPIFTGLKPDKSTPQTAGAAITWIATATDPENDPLQYQFFLDDQPKTGWSEDPTWTWTTSTNDAGSHTIEVLLRDGNHAGPDKFDDLINSSFVITAAAVPEVLNPALANQPPIIQSLDADKPSSQAAGAVVTWTASASDPENDPVQFRFMLDGQPKTSWTENPSWTWTTSEADIGSHSIEVRARDNKHNQDGDDSRGVNFVIAASPNHPPTISSLNADLASPQIAGKEVTWTANASDPENDPVQFCFLLDGQPKTGWIENPIWTWTTSEADVGAHSIEVRVRDSRHNQDGDDSRGVNFVIAASPNHPPTISSLNADLASPQIAGKEVTWTANASDPENDPVQFCFLLDGQPKTGWIENPIWTWTTSEADVGTHSIEVRVRDSRHNQDGDDSRGVNFVIAASPNHPPTIGSLTADLASPQAAGAAMTWIANASDPENDQILYRFFLDGLPVNDWSNESSWTWKTSTTEIGNHTIMVQAKDGNHNQDADDSKEGIFSLKETASPVVWWARCNLYFMKGSYDEAIQACNISYELDPKNPLPLFQKGEAFFAKGEYNQALISYRQAINLNPRYELGNSDYAKIWISYARALEKLSLCEEALEAFSKAEELDPSIHADIGTC